MKDKPSSTNNDQYRLLFSTGIITSFFAYIGNRTQIIKWLTVAAERILFIALIVSAILSFLYLLLIAASLKHEERNILAIVRTNKKQAALLYDLSVDVFMFVPIAFFIGKFTDLLYKQYSKDIAPYLMVVVFAFVILLIRYVWPALFWLLSMAYRPADKGTPLYDNEKLVTMLVAIFLIVFAPNMNIIKRIILSVVFMGSVIAATMRIKNKKK